MKKILDFLFPERQETKNKWWDRLFTVLLFGSAIIVLALAIFFSISNKNDTWEWVTYSPVAFSLEPNYQQAKGKEVACQVDMFAFSVPDNEPIVDGGIGVNCNNIILSDSYSKQYGYLYADEMENLQKQFGVDKYNLTNCGSDSTCLINTMNAFLANPAEGEYEKALDNVSLSLKISRSINHGFIFGDIAYWIFIPILTVLAWIIFWSSIVYKSILYIIFGKKKLL